MSVREEYHGLTGFKRDLLVAAAEEETPYGLALKRNLESKYGVEIYHSRLYQNLGDLARIGFLEKGEIDDRTNEYLLTSKGFLALEVGRSEHADAMEERPERAAADGGDSA